MITLDVGPPIGSLNNWKVYLWLMAYQWSMAVCFLSNSERLYKYATDKINLRKMVPLYPFVNHPRACYSYYYLWRDKFRHMDLSWAEYKDWTPNVPILFIGSRDKYFWTKEFEDILLRTEGCAFTRIKSHHWFLWKKPKETNNAIE